MIFENVKRILEEKEISVVDFEEAVELKRGGFYKWKSHDPGVSKVKAAADFLHVSIDELMRQKDA